MLDREGIARVQDKALEEFIAHPPPNPREFSLRVTSGTSGRSPILAIAEHAVSLKTFSRLFWGAERTLICVGTHGLRFFYTALISENPSNCKVLALDGADLTEALPATLEDFSPQKIIGFPTFIMKCATYFGTAARGVTSIACVGELLSPQHEAFFREKFSNATLSWFYGVIEMRNISKESCGFLPLNHYHPNEGVRVEILDTDENGFGDVVVSTTAYGGIPIERYRIGDVACFHPGRCPCGESVTFELAGRRGHDYLKLGGALLIQKEFDRVVGLFGNIIDDYRVEASVIPGSGTQGRIILHARVQRIPSEQLQSEIRERISAELFLTAKETLQNLVQRGHFAPLEIVWTTSSLSGGYKGVKMRLV